MIKSVLKNIYDCEIVEEGVKSKPFTSLVNEVQARAGEDFALHDNKKS